MIGKNTGSSSPAATGSTSLHLDLSKPSIKLTSGGAGPNLAAALAKHILFSRKASKIAKMPKMLNKALPQAVQS